MRKLDSTLIKRVFLGWDKPLLWSLVEWLKSETNSSFNYSAYTIICPSKRAQKRIAELLSGDGRLEKRSILAPKLYSSLTQALSNFTSTNSKSPISITEALIAWDESVKKHNEETPRTSDDKSPLIGPQLVTYLEKLRKELISHNLCIKDIIELAPDLLSNSQQNLLEELSQVEGHYEEILDSHNLYDRILDQEILIPKTKFIFVGYHKISPLEISLIEEHQLEAYFLIGAPEDEANNFSNEGALQVDSWKQKPSPIEVNIVPNSFMEIDFIKAILGKSPQDTSCCILEESLIGPLQASLLNENLHFIALGSKPFTNSLWGSWILAFLGLHENTANGLNEFFSHPLSGGEEISERLDLLISKNALELETLNDIYEVILRNDKSDFLLKFPYLSDPLKEESTLSAYSLAIIDILSLKIKTIAAIENPDEILTIAKELHALINSPFKEHVLSLRDFKQILRDRLINIDSTHLDSDGIPIIGWQETYLDDASTTVVSDCVEGNIPEYPPSDPILTDSIKARLGLPLRDYYQARDNFLLYHLKHSREKTLFLASKENLEGDLNKLSKLFLQDIEEEILLKTLSRFYTHKRSTQVKNLKSKKSASSVLPLPPEVAYENFPIESLHISPSQIKDYLKCPYHFYLRYILKLSLEDYSPEELPPFINGQLLHNVFAKVGESILTNTPKTKAEIISRANYILDKSLHTYLKNRSKEYIYHIQASLLKSKINSYANYEWDFLSKAPLAVYTEIEAKDFLSLTLNNQETISLKGRIDRVEIFEDSIQIVDFKTGDTELKISQCYKNGEWLDPQLPLYGIFVNKNFHEHSDKPIKLKLHNFSSTDNKAYIHELTPEDISKVTETAQAVAQSILNADFGTIKMMDSAIIKRLAGNFGVSK